MTEFRPRFFHSDAEIEHLGEGLLARTLSRTEWTHEAHLAATTYLLLRRRDVDLDTGLADIIRRFNESVGGVNSDTEGYHETITRVFLHGVRFFLSEADWANRCESLSTSCCRRRWAGATGRCASIRANGCSRSWLAGISSIPIFVCFPHDRDVCRKGTDGGYRRDESEDLVALECRLACGGHHLPFGHGGASRDARPFGRRAIEGAL